jgi:chitinase
MHAGMNIQRTTLKHKLLTGLALAAASFSTQATEVAPYFYTWAFGSSGYTANSLARAKSQGANAVTLAFGTSNGSCTLQGFNFSSSTKTDVQNFLAGGGRVILSFGGADGPFLTTLILTPAFFAFLIRVTTLPGNPLGSTGSTVNET